MGQIISQCGDRINQMALIGLVYSKFGASSTQLAKLFSFAIFPVFVVGPIAGVYVDRWSKKLTMFYTDLLRGILVLSIAFYFLNWNTFIPVYVLVFLVFCVSRFFIPAKMSIIPEIVAPEDITIANSLISITGMVAAVFGFGIGGYLVEKIGPKNSFILDSFTFFVSGLFILGITKKDRSHFSKKEILDLAKSVANNVKRTVFQDIKEGAVYLFKEKSSLFTLRSMLILFGALGSLYTVLIVFIQKTLKSTTQDLGILVVFFGTGLFISALVYGRFGSKVSIEKMIPRLLFCGSIVLAGFVLTIIKFPIISVALPLSFLLGICIGPIIVGTTTLIHKTCDSNLHGRIFSSLEVLIHLSFILLMFLGSFLAKVMGEARFILLIGLLLAMYALCDILINYAQSKRT